MSEARWELMMMMMMMIKGMFGVQVIAKSHAQGDFKMSSKSLGNLKNAPWSFQSSSESP